MPTTSLRQRLVALSAAGILPLAIMAGISLHALQRQQSEQAARVGVELARSVANSIDAELRSTIAVLQTLGTSPVLDHPAPAAFRDRARRIMDTRTRWTAIVLSDPRGVPIAGTWPDGAPIGSMPADRATFDSVVRTREPAVSSLLPYPPDSWLFAVHVPVIRRSAVEFVITAFVSPDAIRDVLTRQQLPTDWVISIVDRNGRRVARSRAHESNLGGRLSETAQRVVDAGGAEGFGVSYTLEGERIFTPYSRLPSYGWVAVLGFPTALVDQVGRRALVTYGGGILLSILIGTLCVIWVARTVTRPIAELRAAAEAVGRRESPPVVEASIQEIRDVGAALAGAADDLKRGEADRDELLRNERLAREAAEAADRAKDEFMAVLSHELRTPLNAVYGWAKMLQSGQLRDEVMAQRARDAIVRNADVQMQLIDDLLDLSRITTGKLRLDVRRVDLPAVLQGAVDAVRPAADAKGIRLLTAFESAAPPVVADPARLQQIIWNLLMNAVKFTERGGEVRLQLRWRESSVEVVVSDTGRGIPAAILPHVFERFRQADSSSTRAHGGLGLGLTLVKHLVEQHGGTVLAESGGEGCGATFTVKLPSAEYGRTQDAVHRAAPGSVAGALANVARIDGTRVLVVDDDPEGLTLTETILAGAGALVRTCTSVAAAMDALRGSSFDVLVSDIEMPEEDGYSLIRRIRALPPEAGGVVPAVALTAYGRPQDRARALTAGYTMHVPKPVDPGELTTIVAGLAGESGQRPPS